MNRAADVQRTDWTADTDLGWLLHTITRRHSNLANDVLGSSVGGVRGYWILTVAATSARRQNEIGDQLGIDRTVLTHLIDGLEAATLVQRTQDAGDRRARLVRITDQGRTSLGALAGRVADIDGRLLVGLNRAEQPQLRALLRRVASAPNPVNGRSVDRTAPVIAHGPSCRV